MKKEIPYYSQFLDVLNPDWKNRSCSVVCLKMALDYFAPENSPSLDDLIEEGVMIGGYGEHGWKHPSIALLAHNHGVPAYCEEFRSVTVNIHDKTFSKSLFEGVMLETGITKIINTLKQGGLVIVSVPRNMQEGGTFHTVLLTGFEEKDGGIEGFYYHDPDAENDSKKDQWITTQDFGVFWRKMAIFLG
jgi:hypothetical protein